MKKLLCIILTIYSCSITIKASDIDSLKQLITTLSENTQKVDQLNLLSQYLIIEAQYDSSKANAQQSIQLAKKLSYTIGEGDAWLQYAEATAMDNDRLKAIEYFKKALAIYKEANHILGIANTLTYMGGNFYFVQVHEKAKEQLDEALKLYEELDNQLGISNVYAIYAMIYDDGINTEKALSYYFKAIKIKESLSLSKGDKMQLIYTYANTGFCYLNMKEYELSRKYNLIAIEKLLANNDFSNAAVVLGNVADSYFKEKNYKKAKEYNLLVHKYAQQVNSTFALSMSYCLFGELQLIYFEQSFNPIHLDSAMFFSTKSITLSDEIEDKLGSAHAYKSLGKVEFIQGNYQNSIAHYQTSINLFVSFDNALFLGENYKGISDCYEKIGDIDQAFYYYKKFKSISDSLNSIQLNKNIYKVEAENKLYKQTQLDLKEKNKINERNFLQYSGAFLFIIFLFILFNFSGKFNFPILVTKGGIFLTILLLFEFILVYMDPYIDNWTGGAPAYKLIINASLAALIFPLHNFFEGRMNKKKKTKI